MGSSESPLMMPFKSKKPLLTTPNKKMNNPSSVGPAVGTPERSNPNPATRIRNQNFALSISDVRRTALQLRKPNFSGSDTPKVGTEKLFESGITRKPNRSEKSTPILPEKFQMLCDFFIAMVNSMRLLRQKGVPGTLTKLARNIESLTDRRFTLHHLAQMKYIVPEVIVAKKIRVLDEKTKCMEEELLVSLDMDALEIEKDAKRGDGFSQLKKIFQSRVIEFSKTHLEDDDIPEGELPNRFNHPKKEPEPILNKSPAPLATSLTGPSFKRRFSSRSLGSPVSESMPAESFGMTVEADATPLKPDSTPLKPDSTPSKFASIPIKLASTPAELALTPAKLMAATPALRTPKRTLMTPDHVSCNLPMNSAKRSRSLKFDESSADIEDHLSPVDEEESIAPAKSSLIAKDDILEILPEGLLLSLKEKERRILEEKNPVVSSAKRRQQMLIRVPNLFDMIRLLFQSIKRTVITKEELIYKLLAGNLGIVDRSEVEEQLELLQEVAPEFLSEKLSISGDTLVSLNKCSCPDSIRAKLQEAK